MPVVLQVAGNSILSSPGAIVIPLINTLRPAFAAVPLRPGLAAPVTPGTWNKVVDAQRTWRFYVDTNPSTAYKTQTGVSVNYTPEADGDAFLLSQTGLSTLVGRTITMDEVAFISGVAQPANASPKTVGLVVQSAIVPLQANIQTPTAQYTINQAITPDVPVVGAQGIPPYTYAVAPPFATGLTYSTSTGQRAGTPTVTENPTNHTITVTDSATPTQSSAQAVVSESVTQVINTALPTVLGTIANQMVQDTSYTINPGTWTLNGGPVTPTSRTWDLYKNHIFYANDPAPSVVQDTANFPLGSVMTLVERAVINGTTYIGVEANAVPYTCVASSSGGTVVKFWTYDSDILYANQFGDVQQVGLDHYFQSGDIPEPGTDFGLGGSINGNANRIWKHTDPLGLLGTVTRLAILNSDPFTAGGIRTDLLANGGFTNGMTVWWAWMGIMPSAIWNRTGPGFGVGNYMTWMDLHGGNTNSHWTIALRSAENAATKALMYVLYDPAPQGGYLNQNITSFITPDTILKIVVQEKMDNTGAGGGFVKCWINDVLAASFTGKNATAGDNNGYQKLACYAGGGTVPAGGYWYDTKRVFTADDATGPYTNTQISAAI